jgi:putative holliday junction resolvase
MMTSFCGSAAREPEEHASPAVTTAVRTHAPSRVTAAIILLRVRVLGIDYGARRIGLALSDASGTLASPWRMIVRPASEAETLTMMVREIERLLVEDDGLAAVVVGWPRRLDGSPTHQTAVVEAFTRALRERVSVPVTLQDERLSSHEADTRLAVREKDWRRRKEKIDAAAAAVVLQDYLDTRL